MKLLNGDCLELMKDIPDKSIDFLITDPPFGIEGEEKIEDVLIRLKEADRVCKNMIILMDYRNFWQVDHLFHDKKIGEIIWEYGWVSGGRTKAKSGFFPTHNTIGLYGDKENFKFLQGSIIYREKGLSSPRQCSYAKKTGHPYEKPIKLFELILRQLNNCNSVLDCFMGSGTTGVACVNEYRDFIGIELDENYFNIAKKRIDYESDRIMKLLNKKTITEKEKELFEFFIEKERKELQKKEDKTKVVRCKDCKYYKTGNPNAKYCYHERYDDFSQGVTYEPNDFCSYGERK